MVPPHDFFGLPIGVGVYLVALLAFALSAYLFYNRVFKLITLGKPDMRWDRPWPRLLRMLKIVFAQRKVLQSVSLKDRAGLGHAAIFFGFLSFTTSYILFIFLDSLVPDASTAILGEGVARGFTIYVDVVGVAILLALIWGVLRRWVVKPHRLTFDLTRAPDSIIIVALIGALMVFTFLTEGFYIRSGGAGPATAAPVGQFLAGGLFAGVSKAAALTLHAVFWWLHLGVILGFAVYIPLSKHMHIVASPLNAFFNDLGPRGALRPIRDIEKQEHFGAGTVQDFTWKELLDGYACAVCGRCTDNCPANITGKVPSPMHIVENAKHHLMAMGPAVRAARAQGKPDPEPEKPLIGGAIPEEAVWDCVTCGACEQECPVAVEHIDSIIDMRRYLVLEESKMPETAKQALLSMERRGHPWRGTTFSRTDWMKGLGVKTLAEDPSIEILYWVGCTSALDERSQKIAIANVKLFQAAGVKFGVLGAEETCTGDPARRMGNEYMFQLMAQQNIETFKKYNIKKIIASCPHCFNTIRNEYPQFGSSYEVVHHTQFLAELLREGKLKPSEGKELSITLHDSCYLTRHNNVVDEPRIVLQAIPGVKTTEMQRCKKGTFCCGAGGGHMWMEEGGAKRINHHRTEQVLETDAKVVATACPFCLQMFEEGIRSKDVQEKLQAKDIAELLAERIGNGAPPVATPPRAKA